MVLHALFGNEQDGCSNHQAAADHIEDGGADAAGAGQGSTDIIDDICSQSASFLSTLKVISPTFFSPLKEVRTLSRVEIESQSIL